MIIEESRLAAAKQSGGISSSAIYNAVIAAAVDANPAPATILDFGTGSGQLLPVLADHFPGAKLHAADIMERPADLPEYVTWHRGDLNHEAPIAAASFEMVFAVEVIEHLENPRHMIREIARLLTPGGVAIMSTPNTGSIRSIVTFAARGHHAQFDDSNYPAHITPMGEVDFARIGNEAGLKCERFFYTATGMVPKLLSLRWQDLPLVGKSLRGRRFSDNFGVLFRKPIDAQLV
jgi:SAM-dependent methyltransferase